jgi:putative ABC transport system substrate-binding protein
MNRRAVLARLGGAAASCVACRVSWPLAARAQQAGKPPTVGFLGQSTPLGESERAAAFAQRLRELGWVEGRTLAIEYRWADGRNERFAEIAAEFVRLKVNVIVTGGTPPVIAARQATSVIPIVFASAGDPVGTGLVASLARPGGNVTGLSVQAVDLAGKRLALLREAISGFGRLAIMGNVGNPIIVLELGELQAAAGKLGLEVLTLKIQRPQDIAPALESVRGRADALYVCQDLLTVGNRMRINTLALGARVPVMHASREHIEAAGLMSYGPNFLDNYRRAADYVDKILRGAKPGDLPVEQPTKFDLVLNLTTARALGLTIPEALLVRADEVIE